MRVAVVDVSAARAAVIEEGLRDAGLTDITVLTERRGLAAAPGSSACRHGRRVSTAPPSSISRRGKQIMMMRPQARITSASLPRLLAVCSKLNGGQSKVGDQ